MARCRWVVGNLTALVDGELSERRVQKVEKHLGACPTCTTEAQNIRSEASFHAQALRFLVRGDSDVSPHQWTRIAARIDEAEASRGFAWQLRPMALVSGVVFLSVIGLVGMTGGPEAVLIPLGVKAPPPAVRRAPELFTKYRMIEKLEMLENFDTVDAVQIDDGEQGKG